MNERKQNRRQNKQTKNIVNKARKLNLNGTHSRSCNKDISQLNVIIASVVPQSISKEFILCSTNTYPGLWFTLLIHIKELKKK